MLFVEWNTFLCGIRWHLAYIFLIWVVLCLYQREHFILIESFRLCCKFFVSTYIVNRNMLDRKWLESHTNNETKHYLPECINARHSMCCRQWWDEDVTRYTQAMTLHKVPFVVRPVASHEREGRLLTCFTAYANQRKKLTYGIHRIFFIWRACLQKKRAGPPLLNKVHL